MTIERTRMSKEDRRDQILTSALNVFVERGYNGATTAEIAKEANISEVTLFRHFESKKEIFTSSIEPIVLTTLKESITASKELSKMEQLEFILTERIKLVSKNRKVILLLLMESQINSELGEMNYINKISTLLEDTLSELGIKVRDDKLTMRLLMGGILSFLYLPEDNEETIREYVKKVMNLIHSK